MYDLPLTFLRDPNVPACVLLVLAIRKYGVDCFDTHPEFLRKDIEEDYQVKLTDLQSDKLQASITVLSTDQFESHWEVFETCCHLFNNQPDDFGTFDPLEAEEIALALAEVEVIRDTTLDAIHYNAEVNVYAGAVFYNYGMCKPPTIFPSALLQKAVECSDDEKNEALGELHAARLSFLKNYMDRLKVMHTE